MTDIEHALNSAKKCTEDKVDEVSSTGANAGSVAETILISNSPLSELVWSQHKGLSLKYTASSLAEKKASVLWNTESFNIIISSPQCINVGESSKTGGFITGAMNSLHLNSNTEFNDYNRAALHGSPRSTLGVQPISSSRMHEQDRGSFGDKELLNRKGKAVLDNNPEHYQSDKKEVDICSPRNRFQMIDSRPELVAFHTNHEKPSMSGADNYGPPADSILCNLKVPAHDLPPGEVCCTTDGGASTDSNGLGRMKNYQASSLAKVAYEVSMSTNHENRGESSSSSKSTDGRKADVAEAVEGNSGNRVTRYRTSFRHRDRQCLGGVQSLDLRGRREVGTSITAALQSTEKIEDGICRASHKDNSSPDWFQSDYNVKPSNKRKGKEHVLPDAGDSWSISKGREDSQESVESSNSRRILSTGKRASGPDLKNSHGFKMIKKQKNCSESSAGQGSSFINWISAITNGYVRSDQAECLSFVPQSIPERNPSSLPKSNGNVGFKSIFQTLYSSSSRVQNDSGLDLQGALDASNEHKVVGGQFVHGFSRMVCANVEFNSCNVVSTANEKMINGSDEHVSSGSARLIHDGNNVQELPTDTINISSTNPRFQEKSKYKFGNTYNTGDVGSPSSCPKLASRPYSEDKGPTSSSNLVANRNFLESPWIKRLSSKVSTARVNTSPCDWGMESASKWLTNSCRSVNYHLPILPSQTSKNSGEMASVFAKRLGAFRHITPLEVSTMTCFFCGKRGHSIRECSEIGETDLEGLLKNMDSYDGADRPSCLCIHCFQLNHWAISCPHTSFKRKQVIGNPLVVGHENCNRTKSKPGDHIFANLDGRTIFSDGGKQEQEQHQSVSEHKIPRSGNVMAATELGMDRIVAPNTKNIWSNQVRKDIGESIVKVDTRDSASREESKEYQIIAFNNFVPTELTDESVRIFETIRQLRLSRTDIIRWMEAPVSNFSLEGFFLRLRLGKWEKDLVGTGYHVASINGANGENCLSVCIKGFIYLVDFRSVSNQDFVEDELKAWWFETLKGGDKLPTIEELNKKLGERTRLGF